MLSLKVLYCLWQALLATPARQLNVAEDKFASSAHFTCACLCVQMHCPCCSAVVCSLAFFLYLALADDHGGLLHMYELAFSFCLGHYQLEQTCVIDFILAQTVNGACLASGYLVLQIFPQG